MPPKKTNNAKVIAKEIKKKNTEEAQKIISMLIPTAITTLDDSSSAVQVDIFPGNAEKTIAKGASDKADDKSGVRPKSNRSLNGSASKIAKDADLPSSNIRARSSGQNAKSFSSRSSNAATKKIYHYEIDCSRVIDSIDVTDLQKYVEEQLKVDGKKSNLGDTVTVRCEDQKVVIRSKVYLPKRSLRFLSKKFLKKAWNIQVSSKNKNSYEYKYVGTA